MKTAFALVALAPLAMAGAIFGRQDGSVPDCASACFQAADGPCSLTDIQCQCTNAEAQTKSTQCLINACPPDAFLQAVGFAAVLCSGSGIDINTTSLPPGVTLPAGYDVPGLTPTGDASASESQAEATPSSSAAPAEETPAPSASAATPAPTTSASGAAASVTSEAASASSAVSASTASLGSSASSVAASATSTGGAMPTGAVNGFAAAVGVGAVVLGLL